MKILRWSILPCLLLVTLHGGEEKKHQPDLYTYFEGREIYLTQCIHCHGKSGRGDGPWAVDWTEHRPRNFRTGVFKFRTTPMGFLPTDEDLRRTIRNGISGTAMPVFRDHLTGRQLEAVIAYIKCLSKKWDDPACYADPVTIPDPPAWYDSADRRRSHVESGRALFSKHCVACHGEKARGDGPSALALKDIWGFDIRPADLGKTHYKSGDRPEAHFRTIAMGLDGTPMVGFRKILSEEQIWDVVAFLAACRRAEKDSR